VHEFVKVLRELHLLQVLWHKVMDLQYQSNTYLEQYTPYCLAEFNAHRIETRQHQVQIASPIEGRIVEIPPMVLATVMFISRKGYVPVMDTNRMIYLILRLNYRFPIVFGPDILLPNPVEPHINSEELPCHAPRTRIPRGRLKKE